MVRRRALVAVGMLVLVALASLAAPTSAGGTDGGDADAPALTPLWRSDAEGLDDVVGVAWDGDALVVLDRNGTASRLWRIDLPAFEPRLVWQGQGTRLGADGGVAVVASKENVTAIDPDGVVLWRHGAPLPRDLVAADGTVAWLEGSGGTHVVRVDLATGERTNATTSTGPRSLPTVNSDYIVWEESPPLALLGDAWGERRDGNGIVRHGGPTGGTPAEGRAEHPAFAQDGDAADGSHPSTFDLWMYHHGTRNVFPLDQAPFAQRFPALDDDAGLVYISEDGGPDADILIDDVADPRSPTVLAEGLQNPTSLAFDGEVVVALTGFGQDSLLRRWHTDGTAMDAVRTGDALQTTVHGGIAAMRRVRGDAVAVDVLPLPHEDRITVQPASDGCLEVTGQADRLWITGPEGRHRLHAGGLPATVCDVQGVRAWDAAGLGPLRRGDAASDGPGYASPAGGVWGILAAMSAMAIMGRAERGPRLCRTRKDLEVSRV